MSDTVVLGGDLDLINELIGDLSLDHKCDGEVGEFMAIHEALPAYTGVTEITPTNEVQVLETERKSVLENIVINPIPSNYGLITWNGSTLLVS